MQFFVSANPSTTCCDSISRSVSDGTGTSQTAAAAAASFCCPSYENRLLASSRSELNAALGMYTSPYAAAAAASQNYANYFPYSTDPSAIYSTLVGSLQPHLMIGGGWEVFILIDHRGFSHQFISCCQRVCLDKPPSILSIFFFLHLQTSTKSFCILLFFLIPFMTYPSFIVSCVKVIELLKNRRFKLRV